MISKLWLIILVLLPVIMSASAFYLKEMSARSIAIVLSCVMFLISIIATFFKAKLVLFNFEIVLVQTVIPLMVSLSLLVASIASDKNMKEIASIYIIGALCVVLGFAGNITTFVSAWVLSIIILIYSFKIKPAQSIVLLFVSFGYLVLLFHNFMQIFPSNVYAIFFVLFPFLASAIYPLNIWMKDLNEENPALSGIFFILAVIPAVAATKFAVPFVFSIGAEHISIVITIFSIITIFSALIIKSTALSFSSVMLCVVLVLSLFGEKFVSLLSITMIGSLVSFLFLSLQTNSDSRIKKWIFMGLPGGIIFVAIAKIIFIFSETDYIFSICLMISMIIIILKNIFIKNHDEVVFVNNSRVDLAKQILFIVVLVVGVYSKPWFSMFDVNKTDTKNAPMIFIEGTNEH